MENATTKIICPVCGEEGTHLYDKGGFRVARCIACKTLFIENPPEDTSGIYDESYFFGGDGKGGYVVYDAEKEAMRGTFEKCLDRIQKEKSSGALFDVGAATGYFLALARERGFSVRGIDISSSASKEALKKGIPVDTGTFETVSYAKDSFDVVTMFDVLEHVASPPKLIQNVNVILKAGGVLFGSTPDSGSLNAKITGKGWHMLFPPEHLVLLNDKSLRLILEREGFEVLWTGRITKYFTPPYILQTAARWLGLPFLSRLAFALRGTWLARLKIPLDLRDNLFFLARKKT